MTEPDLSRIWALTAEELRGWWSAVVIWSIRREEPGEREMLLKRAGELGLKIDNRQIFHLRQPAASE